MNNLFISLKSSLESLKNSNSIDLLREKIESLRKPKEVPVVADPVWSYLKAGYFQNPRVWNLNSADLYPYFRVILYAGILIILLLVLLLSTLLQGSSNQQAAMFNQTVDAFSKDTDKFQTKSKDYLAKFPQGIYAVQVSRMQTDFSHLRFLSAMNQAQHQPSLPLRMQAYQTILNQNLANDPLTKKELEEKINTYSKKVEAYEAQLAKARTYSQKEYYTSSLLLLSKLVKGGPQYGNLYTEAQDLLNRTSAKKIEFYLVKGQLRKARIALRDAKLYGVSSEVIDSLAKKIKNLEQLKPMR
jgi:tetratricopeptide (TPR) repeat protein